MKIKLHWLIAWGGIVTSFWYCSSADNPMQPPQNPTENVSIINGQFVPAELTISVGTTVRWTNNDNEVRTVESGTPMNPTSDFNSPNLDPNATFSHTFTSAGSFNYYSSISGATGRIIVQ